MGSELSRELEKAGVNPYNVLGVDKKAPLSEIKKAFKTKSKILHPDRNPNNPEIEKEYKLLIIAYQILSNPDERKKFDGDSTHKHHELKNKYKTTIKDSNSEAYINVNEELKNASVGKEFNNKFNKLFEKTKKTQPGDKGYEDELGMNKRMTEKDIKRGYKNLAKDFKPKRMFQKGQNFDNNKFNAYFNHYKSNYDNNNQNEIIHAQDIQGFGDLGASSAFSTNISNYNGLMIVGDDKEFGSSTGDYFDYKESFGGNHYNPTDFDNNIDMNYDPDVSAIPESEFNRLMDRRNTEFKQDIEPVENEADLDRKTMEKIRKETKDMKDFAFKYIDQYPQNFLDDAENNKLDTNSYQLTDAMNLLRLDSTPTRNDSKDLNNNYNDMIQERNNITKNNFQRF